jgi:hypothetical protein
LELGIDFLEGTIVGFSFIQHLFFCQTSYFAAKKQKINLQYEQDKREREAEEAAGAVTLSSSKFLFKNIGIFVNGYTIPTEIELKAIMLNHGGTFCEYMSDKVTYIVAAQLAHSKALMLKNKTVIRPEWIVDW